MKLELTNRSIVDFFVSELGNWEFIGKEHHGFVQEHLEQLCEKDISRHQKSMAACELWKLFFERALAATTDNLRGCRELCDYFDEYFEYEDLLFAIDERYRDHTIHSVWVMLLGLYLKKNCNAFEYMDFTGTFITQGDGAELCVKEIQDRMREKYEIPLWCLVALAHDLGYPIEKTQRANKRMSRMIQKFGFLSLKDFDYDFTVVHQTAINELLSLISLRAVCDSNSNFAVSYSCGDRLDFAKSFEWLAHGIMSAYLLQMHLDWICDSMDFIPDACVTIQNNGKGDASTQVTQMAIITNLLCSISAHTNKNTYNDRFNRMSTLLFICDELDEFSRYARSPLTKAWEEVDRGTELECNSATLRMIYTIKKKTEDDEAQKFFNEKVEKTHSRFKLTDVGIKEVSVVCKDITENPEVTYRYEKKFPFEITVECMIGDKVQQMTDLLNRLPAI